MLEPGSLSESLDKMGLTKTGLAHQLSLLYFALRHVLDLSLFKSDIQTTTQVACIGYLDDDVIDLYNEGKPLESPLGYTVEDHTHIGKFFDYTR